jgi:hypothetical protein
VASLYQPLERIMRNVFKSNLKALPWTMALLLSAVAAGCGGGGGGGSGVIGAGAGTGVGGLGRGPAPVNLGTAGNYAILAQSKITSVPTSAITGTLGLSPASGTFYTIDCGEVLGGGVVHAADAGGPAPCVSNQSVALTTAIGDKDIAFTDANSRAADYTELAAGNIGGLTLGPATYKWSSAVLIPSTVTLSGGPNDVWIFQIAQGLTVSPGVQIILSGGALPEHVFWATGQTTALDTTVQFKGIVISSADITVNTNASVNGRLLAKTAVTLDHSTVTQP